MCQSFRDDCISNDPFWPCFDLKFDLGNLDADGEAAETIKQAQSERARGIQNLQDQLKEAKMMQDKQDEQNLFEKVGISGPPESGDLTVRIWLNSQLNDSDPWKISSKW